MQPTIICTAPEPGLLRINGRFAGEISAGRPLCAPVSPVGPVYLEYAPLAGSAPALARRCVFSGGRPLAESLALAEGLACVVWPGGAVEIELCAARTDCDCFSLEGRPCRLIRGDAALLRMDGAALPLPAGALPPRLARVNGTPLLLGEVEGGGQYAAALSADLRCETGLLAAARIDLAGGALNALIDLDDAVGHGRLEQWIPGEDGLRLASSEPVWVHGAPRWPDTAEGAMIAAVQAALAGLRAEAEGYLAPALAAESPLDAVAGGCDLCVPMRYGAPEGWPCVGLLTVENDHLAAVRPLYYRAAPAGGRQGSWRIEALQRE